MIFNSLNPMGAKNLDAGKYADGQGLWLIKRSKQRGKWILRLAVGGHRREMGLGGWPQVGIAEAREAAKVSRAQTRNGLDPIVDREKVRVKELRITVSKAIDGCFKSRQAELKNVGNAGRWMSPLSTHVIPKIGNLSIEELDQHAIKRTLEPIWHS